MGEDKNHGLNQYRHDLGEGRIGQPQGTNIFDATIELIKILILIAPCLVVLFIMNFIVDNLDLVIIGILIAIPISIWIFRSERRYAKQFDYHDFSMTWEEGYLEVEIEGKTNDEGPAKRLFWKKLEPEIRAELQKWKDDGWEIADRIAPNNLKVTKSRRRSGLFSVNTYFEPAEFCLKLRKRKASSDS